MTLTLLLISPFYACEWLLTLYAWLCHFSKDPDVELTSSCLHVDILAVFPMPHPVEKKKILNLFSLPSFSMCVNGGMAVPGCVVVCTCMGVLWGVGKEICEKLSHQRLFSHLTPVSQHVPGRWSSSIPLGLTVSRGPFCHCLHQYS